MAKAPRLYRVGFAVLLAAGLALGSPANGAAEPSVEYRVKAAFLSKFGNFVQWPAERAGGGDRPAAICVVGKDPFGEALDQAVSGKHMDGREISVRRIAKATPDAVGDCHILYAGDTSPDEVMAALDSVRGKDVLTVTDQPLEGDTAPVIAFVIRENSVRFQIDETAASENQLVISSQLLSLATSVKTAR